MATRSPELVIVMPAYNEEGCIADVVRTWLSVLETAGFFNQMGRLIVVNDGSKDMTGKILDEMAKADARIHVVHQVNAGHGRAVTKGYETALELGANWIFQVDSDDQFEPNDFLRLWNLRNSTHFVLGFRQARHDALHRLVITRMVRIALFLMFGAWLKDSNIPFRLISATWLKSALDVLPANLFAPNIFLTILAARSKQKLGFIPVLHKERRTGVVSILRLKLVKVCWRGLQELFQFRLDFPSRDYLLKMQQLPIPGSVDTRDMPSKIA